jgi:hypothetical protein
MSFALRILVKFTQGGGVEITVSRPADGPNLAAERKLGEVSTRRKQSVFTLLSSPAVHSTNIYNKVSFTLVTNCRAFRKPCVAQI